MEVRQWSEPGLRTRSGQAKPVARCGYFGGRGQASPAAGRGAYEGAGMIGSPRRPSLAPVRLLAVVIGLVRGFAGGSLSPGRLLGDRALHDGLRFVKGAALVPSRRQSPPNAREWHCSIPQANTINFK